MVTSYHILTNHLIWLHHLFCIVKQLFIETHDQLTTKTTTYTRPPHDQTLQQRSHEQKTKRINPKLKCDHAHMAFCDR